MELEHAAIWTHQIESLRDFYERYFGAAANEKYTSEKGEKGRFESYFLTLIRVRGWNL